MLTLEALGSRRIARLDARRRGALYRAVEAAETAAALFHRQRAGTPRVPHPIALTPFVVSRLQLPVLERLADCVHRFQALAPTLYREDVAGFRTLCPLSEAAAGWLLTYRGAEPRAGLMIRPDVGLTGGDGRAGWPSLFETNATALAGLYNHSAGVTITKVTLTFKQEGSSNAYTLDPATGVITSTGAFTADTALVLSYRTESQFGYSRHSGDSIQAVYVPPANDSTDIGQEQGDWQGLPYQDGTYTVDVWFYKNIDLGLENELQTYRSTSNAGTADFLFGGVTEIVPHEIISTSANCYTCHNDVIFHGGGRRGLDACLTCHSLSGNEDKPRWDTPKVGTSTTNTALTTGVAIEFRQMLHKIHRGSGLANAATYTVVGNQGNPSTFEEINFPAMPGGVRQCVRCHGNDAWKAPAARTHELADVPVKTWTTVCSACHDSDLAEIHFAINTSSGGDESCAVCHDVGREFAVEKMHLPR